MSSESPKEQTDLKETKEITFKDNKKAFILKFIKSVGLFIYDHKNKKFIGRESLSWSYLGVMYTIFYSLIGGFGWAMVAIFMAIALVDPSKPKYYAQNGPLAYSSFMPGMGVRPHLGTGDPVIDYSISNPTDYVKLLDSFLKDYQQNLPKTEDCDMYNSTNDGKHTCKYDVFEYLKSLNCDSTNQYGYASGLPCVLVKINNLFDWYPGEVYAPTQDVLAKNPGCNDSSTNATINFNNNIKYIFVTCNGDSQNDIKNINSIDFASPIGKNKCLAKIPFFYYPYLNAPNYMQPLVVLRMNVTRNVPVTISCMAWSTNFKGQDFKNVRGAIKFVVNVNT